MKKQKIKIGIALTISSMVASQACQSQTDKDAKDDNSQQSTKDICTDSVKLEKRLLKLSKTKYNGELATGAMCYVMAAPEMGDYTCPYCNTVAKGKYNEWQLNGIYEIEKIVSQLKEAGFDVMLDKTEYCEHCSNGIATTPELIFKIRFSDNAPYHVAKSNIVNEYQCLLSFVEGNKKYPDNINGEEYALHDNIGIIKKMTGLGTNIVVNEEE